MSEAPETTTDPAAAEFAESHDHQSDAGETGAARASNGSESSTSSAEDEGAPRDRVKDLEAEGDIAADYLEELLDIADLDGDLDMDVEGDRASVSIVGP